MDFGGIKTYGIGGNSVALASRKLRGVLVTEDARRANVANIEGVARMM